MAGLDALVAMIRPSCPCSRNTVHRFMKLYNIHSIRKKAFRITTNSNHNYAVSPNLLKIDFTADKPNQKWVGDITYIPTDEGWLYAAIVKDLCLKKIASYAFSDNIEINLTITALEMAINHQKPQTKLIFHSDRAVQYVSLGYHETCVLCYHRTTYYSFDELKEAIVKYIKYYNEKRIKEKLGWMSPVQYRLNALAA